MVAELRQLEKPNGCLGGPKSLFEYNNIHLIQARTTVLHQVTLFMIQPRSDMSGISVD